MPTIDLFFLLGFTASVLLGAWRGLIYEVLSVLGWVAAFMGAQWWAAWAAVRLPVQDFSEPLRYAAGFAVVFITIAFGAGLVSWLFSQFMTAVGLRPVDRVLGAAFGLLRALVMSLALVLLVNMTPLKQQEGWQASHSVPWLQMGLHWLQSVLPDNLARYFP